jgi:transposase
MSVPRRLERHSTHLSERERAVIINRVEQGGESQAAVARSLMIAPNTVRNTIAHFHREGHLRDSHGGGHEIAYNDEQMERLWDLILERGRLTAKGLLREMGDSAPRITERTMQRYRHILNLSPRHGRITARGMVLHHDQRAAWAWEHRRDPITTWLHSDESTMCMRESGEIVWIPIGEPIPELEVDVLRCHVNMWGVVWDGGSIFTQYRGHLTAAAFTDLLDEHLLPHIENLSDRVFLLDRHTAHTAKFTKKWLDDHGLVWKLLPTHSPHFNAIEECWSWIKRWARQCEPDSLNLLEAALDAACTGLPQDVIDGFLRHAQKSVRDYAAADASLES